MKDFQETPACDWILKYKLDPQEPNIHDNSTLSKFFDRAS